MSLVLIADSGSTKTDWVALLNGDEIFSFQTIGLNPYFTTEEVYREVFTQLKNNLPSGKTFDSIYFYGAGCSAKDKVDWLSNLITDFFGTASVEVMHDMLGAARAMCGNNPGMVAILGTGSNSCLYDGNAIIANRKALGYVLGDEGSGANIGKLFIQKLLNEELDPNSINQFYLSTGLDADQIIHNVYKEPFPNRFLASFSSWLNQNDPSLFDAIASESFQCFFDKHITQYEQFKEIPLYVIGSVGYYNKTILQKIADLNGVELKKVSRSPILGLIKYHK